MKYIIIFSIALLTLSVKAQDVLLSENVKADSLIPTKGPNLKNYSHLYFGVDFPFRTGDEENVIKQGLSSGYSIGYRYKRKLTGFLALGLDASVNFRDYQIREEFITGETEGMINYRENLHFSSLNGAGYIRINVGRRGNSLGNYLDIGAFGGWNMTKKHKSAFKNSENEKVKTTISRLNYIETFTYGLNARLGAGRYAITASYRLSDYIKTKNIYPELPRLTAGFEIGLFK
jgi:hypothetical protein